MRNNIKIINTSKNQNDLPQASQTISTSKKSAHQHIYTSTHQLIK